MDSTPFVSIIIPALNAASTIVKCLESIEDLDYSKENLEIIVVDNGSVDETRNIVKSLGANLIIDSKSRIGGLRNAGASLARGTILAFTDSDCLVPKFWLVRATELMRVQNVGAVGGGCLVPANASWMEKAWVVEQKDQVKEVKYLPASDFIITRDVFNEVGGFDDSLIAGEDDAISIKLREYGYSLISHISCYVIHLGYPKKLREILKRQIWHAKSSLNIRKNLFDKTAIFTHLFTIIMMFFPIAIILSIKTKASLTGLIICLILLPSISALKKSFGKNRYYNRIQQFFLLIPIYFFYYIGRSLGLVLNYKCILSKGFRKIIQNL